MIRYIVDRFEGDMAVCECEDGGYIELSRATIPKECKEGDCIIDTDDGIIIDKEETKRRKELVKNILKELKLG